MTEKNMNCKELFQKLKLLFHRNDAPDDEVITPDEIYEACAALKHERDIYHMAIDNCVDSFHIADGNGNVVFVNKSFEKRTRVKREAVIGKNVRQMPYKPSGVALALKEKRQVSIIQGGPGGDAVVTVTPVKDENGDIIICVSNARFIDELTLMDRYYGKKNEQEKNEDKGKRLVFKDKSMVKLYEFAGRIAAADSGVLITGETGTGKSMIARYIHENSPRSKERFIELNCAAIPENLIESELFGYEAGAFTGARKGGKPGLFELADGGTLFLDEIGDMPMSLQPKLLAAIQNRTIMRVGGVAEKPVDVRIITATNKNLEKLVEEDLFRSDLYYRINIVPLHMPALRERKDDINNLIQFFLDLFNKRYLREVVIDEDAVALLNRYRWPGNIRELENMMERLVVTSKSGIITEEDLPSNIKIMTEDLKDDIKVNRIMPLGDAMEIVEKQLVQMAFAEGSSTYEAARILGISQSGASRKYLKYVKNNE